MWFTNWIKGLLKEVNAMVDALAERVRVFIGVEEQKVETAVKRKVGKTKAKAKKVEAEVLSMAAEAWKLAVNIFAVIGVLFVCSLIGKLLIELIAG